MRALLILANPALPCHTLDWPDDSNPSPQIRALVGSPLNTAVYDRDVLLWLRGDSVRENLQVNSRATRYMNGHSQSSARMPADGAGYDLHGDIVATGTERDDEYCDVPERLVARVTAMRDPR